MYKERLQKIIAANTKYSRRKAEELIINGDVKVNGEVITKLGYKASISDDIVIQNKILYKEDLVYYLLNKPINTISSTSDEKNRIVITDLIHESIKIYPVGRLDYNTTGLIILTNDGTLANGLMHPSNHVNKKYIVKIKGQITKDELYMLRNGIKIDNYTTQKAKIKIIKYNRNKNETKLSIIIIEGKNRQIRKMFESINKKVIKLHRQEYGIFSLDNEELPGGSYRKLKIKEVQLLYNLFKGNKYD